MNTIKITVKQFNEICFRDGSRIIPDHFPFDEFLIKIYGHEPIKVMLYKGFRVFDFELQVNGKKIRIKCNRDEIEYPRLQGISKETADEAALLYRSIIHDITSYIMSCPRNRKETHPIPRKYSREHRISTSQNKVYLLDDIVKYVHDNYVPQGGTHNIRCECWEVRGHYRTYKGGKKVWINAYKKGKKRNEIEPKDKTYYLSKGVTV